MTDLYGISLRQPQPWDLVGRTLAIAALGTAFEASYGWVIRAPDGVLAEGFFTAGSMGLLESFVHQESITTDYIGTATSSCPATTPAGCGTPGWTPSRSRSS